MDDRIDSLALDHVVYHLAIADIALNEREPLVLGEGLEISQVAGVRQSVESDDYVAPVMLGPEMDEVGANKSGGTRYQHPTHRDPFPRSFGPVSWWSKIECLARRFASDRGMASERYRSITHPPMPLATSAHISLINGAISFTVAIRSAPAAASAACGIP